MKRKRLTQEFFNRPTLAVAEALLGKFLIRKWRGRDISLMITEVEAYDGFKDRASHASRGKTLRNTPMFGQPGHWYVYFTYGMHWMMNIVTKEAGYPAAVLIRGGLATGKDDETVLVIGPARLTKFLKIDGKLTGLPASTKTGLWFEDRGVKKRGNWIYPPSYKTSEDDFSHKAKIKIRRGPRVGIDSAGKYWASKPWRLRLETTY